MMTEKIDFEKLKVIGKKFNLSYHISYFGQYLTEFNPAGKDMY
jgi:hypothetical protein